MQRPKRVNVLAVLAIAAACVLGALYATQDLLPDLSTPSSFAATWPETLATTSNPEDGNGSGVVDASVSVEDSDAAEAAVDDGSTVDGTSLITSPLVIAPKATSSPRRAAQAASSGSEGDGTKIEEVSVEWVTADTPADDGDAARLLVTPAGDSPVGMQMRVNLALSGQHDYAAGDVRITIPKNVIRTRSGSYTGTWTLSVPEDPSRRALFSYTETADSFVLTNTRRLSAATQAMFELSIRNVVPHTVVGDPDAYESDPVSATVEVTTAAGNVLSMSSEGITVRFDTSETLTSASDRAVKWQLSYPSDWPSELTPDDPDQWVYVDFYSYPYKSGNQAYGLSETHTVSSSDMEGGVILGMRDSNGQTYAGDGTDTLTASLSSEEYGPAHYTHVYAAWPREQLEQAGSSTVHANDSVTYTLTSADDRQVSEATARATISIAYVPFEAPSGHFITRKYGWSPSDSSSDTTDPTGLNSLASGSDSSVGFTVEATGFTGPWTWVDGDGDGEVSQDELGQRSVAFDVRDTPLTFDGTALADEDYDVTSVTLVRPTVYDYVQYETMGYGYREPSTRYGTSSVTYGSISTGEWGYRQTSDATKVPDVTFQAYVDGSWQTVGTVGWSTGSPTLSGASEGTSLDGYRLTLPAHTKRVRATLETSASAVFLRFRPTVTLHATDAVRAAAEEAISGQEKPCAYLVNQVEGDFTQADTGEAILHDGPRQAVDRLQGAYQGASLSKTVTYSNDAEYRLVRLHYTSTLREQTNITESSDLASAREAGAVTDERGGTFFDLLPAHVTPDVSSVRATSSGDTVTSVRTVEDWRGSGRTLLVAHVSMTPRRSYVSRYYGILGQEGLLDTHAIAFDATYTWEAMTDHGREITNVIAYESDNAWVGNVSGLSGEPDDPTAGNSTSSASATSGVESLMTDLDDGRDDPSFLYARSSTSLSVDTSALTSLHKDASVNGSGTWSEGLDSDELNVYESGTYEYRLRLENDASTEAEDVVIYDSLEAYVPGEDKTQDHGDRQWRGTLASVDVSQIESMGVAPVVYYSTRSDLRLDDTSDRTDMDLTDTSVWTTVPPTDLSEVHAVAIDCTTAADGSAYTLPASKSLVAYLRMRAPRAAAVDAEDPSAVYDTTLADTESEAGDDGLAGGAHAYNNVTMLATSVSTRNGVRSERQLIRNDYTKVGLLPYRVRVEKSFEDGDDADGIRPSSVTVHLLADGADTGRTAELSEDTGWAATFDDVPATDDTGHAVSYAATDDVSGYTAGSTGSYDSDEGAFVVRLTNRHTPETTDVTGTKRWVDEDETRRPSSVRIDLYRDGELLRSTHTDAANGWAYAFRDLPRYHDHGTEYAYEVREDTYYDGYRPTVEGTDVTNTYEPYGDLTVSKDVVGATDASREAEHTFTLSLTGPDGEPDAGTYGYTTSDGRSGTIGNGGTLTLVGGESATVTRIPSETTYALTETPAAGYTLTSSSGATGSIQAGRTQRAAFTDTYDTTGSVTIVATKTLTGRTLARYQFRFDLLDGDGQVIRSATNDADGAVTFGRIRYGLSDVGRTYTYTIRETDQGKAGYTYDAHEETVSVRVTDDGDGTITATPTYDEDGPIFANSYHAVGTTTVAAWKTLTGRALTDGEFTFRLDPQDGAPVKALAEDGTTVSDVAAGHLTATSAADGTLAFPALAFDETDAGRTYTYVASEVAGTDTSVTYTDRTYTFTVSVVDDGDGTLSFDQTVEETPVFENALRPGPLRIRKIVPEGQGNGDPNQEFTFHVKVTLPDGSPLPDGTYTITRSSIPEDGTDTATAGDGTGGTVPTPTFTDVYSPGTVQATITGQKLVDGSTEGAAGYAFTLSEGGTLLQTKTSSAGGAIAFDPISYTKAEAGTHTYTVSEVAGDDATVEYDAHEETVTVTVTDDGEGTLTPTVTYDDDGVTFRNAHRAGSLAITKAVTGTEDTTREFTVHVAYGDGTSEDVTLHAGDTVTKADLPAGTRYTVSEPTLPSGYSLVGIEGATGTIEAGQTSEATVTNSYAAEGSATIQATKRLEGSTLGEGQFEFGLFEGDTRLSTATNAADGTVAFDTLTYDAVGTHDYVIRELTADSDDFTSDAHEATARVVVTDDGDGHLSTQVTYGTGEAAPTFTNVTRPGTLTVTKSWDDGTNPDPDHVVTLGLTVTQADGAPLTGEVTGTYVSGDTSEDLTLEARSGAITLAHEMGEGASVSLELPLGATYTLTEEAAAGYVCTADVGGTQVEGAVEGTVTRDSEVSLTNTYASSGTWQPAARKVLTGRALTAGEFTFLLVDDAGHTVAQAKNDADGNVTFPPVELDGTEAGRTFWMREVAGDDARMTYDDRVVGLSVTASDDGEGHLVAAVTYDGSDDVPTFTNTYGVPVPETGGGGILATTAAGLATVIAACLLALRRSSRRDG